MPKKVTAWQAIDGKLFEAEDDAKAWEFEQALRGWATDRLALGKIVDLDAVIEDRAKLLPIFKLLNGGNPIAAPALLPPSDKIVNFSTQET